MRAKVLRWGVAAFVSLFLFAGVSVSFDVVPENEVARRRLTLRVGPEKAEAIVGRPLTPVSVAGVARRSVRRATYY